MMPRQRRVVIILVVLLLISVVVTLLFYQPRWLLARLPSSGAVLYFVETDRPVVALTIDDGPDAETTPALLDVLAAHGARATFFLISERVAGNEALVSRIVAEGHELGNHLTRDEPSIRLPPAAFDSALLEAHRVLSRFGPVRWARPAGGWYSDAMLATMARYGYRCALGSVYPYDAAVPWVNFAALQIRANVRPGSVMILHDGGARGARAAATLRRVLPALERRNIAVTTLSELVAAGENVNR